MTAHGTITGYSTNKCRCVDCKRANAEYVRRQKRVERIAVRRLREAHYVEYRAYLADAWRALHVAEGWQDGRRRKVAS